MSLVHNTGARLVAWVKGHGLLLVAGAAVLGLVAAIFVGTFRVYDERQARLDAIEALATENRRLAEVNAEQDREQCEGINGVNFTVRFILDGALRNRSPEAPPIPDALRELYVGTYRLLPNIDCITGERTDFAPPFPERTP